MKFLRIFLHVATAVLASTAAFAENAELRTFERDGIVYKYTTTEKDGRTVLRGTADGGAPFRLVVTGQKVRGTVGGKYVSFTKADAQQADTAVIAAR